MSGWGDDYGWDDEPGVVSRVSGTWLLAFFAGMLFACIILFFLLRWSVTTPLLAPIFIGESNPPAQPGLPATPIPIIPTATAVQSQSAPDPARTVIILEATATPLASSSSSTTQFVDTAAFNPDQLKATMLELINRDRAANSLSPVAWDETAALAGQLHVDDMLAQGYFSHWNTNGEGPEHRYANIGGLDAAFENIHSWWFRFTDGRPAPVDDWPARIEEAQAGFMNSDGHRRNILDPYRTHVGIGLGYDTEHGEFRLAQEFINRYVEMEPLPAQASPGETLIIQGVLLPPATDPLINLFYEPFRQPMSIAEVPSGSYHSDSAFSGVFSTDVQADRFQSVVSVPDQPGLYTIYVGVDIGEERVVASELIFSVGSPGK